MYQRVSCEERWVENARSSDPGDFGGESLNVILLSLEDLGRDEHGEVGILDSECLAVRRMASSVRNRIARREVTRRTSQYRTKLRGKTGQTQETG
jgi:hypothetical protein